MFSKQTEAQTIRQKIRVVEAQLHASRTAEPHASADASPAAVTTEPLPESTLRVPLLLFLGSVLALRTFGILAFCPSSTSS